MKKAHFNPIYMIGMSIAGAGIGLILDILWARDDENTVDVCQLKKDVEVLKKLNDVDKVVE